jgi:hypothetical protein
MFSDLIDKMCLGTMPFGRSRTNEIMRVRETRAETIEKSRTCFFVFSKSHLEVNAQQIGESGRSGAGVGG